jgi:hypothetical protein
MANALIGIPIDYTLGNDATAARDEQNLLNDEPGLVYRSASIATSGTKVLDFDLSGTELCDMFMILGQRTSFIGFTHTLRSYPTSTDRTNGTNVTTHATGALAFSANRSANDIKTCIFFGSGTSNRFFRWTITNGASASYFEAWRVLFCTKIQPVDNIEVGASYIVDDRSERRFSRTGRRIIDPTVICPAFQGTWPWITAAEVPKIRKMILTRAGSYPVVFVLDPSDTTWGEDHVFYGDFEKNLQLDYDNDDCNVFKFSIVSIAP